jgi:hypothetical protein
MLNNAIAFLYCRPGGQHTPFEYGNLSVKRSVSSFFGVCLRVFNNRNMGGANKVGRCCSGNADKPGKAQNFLKKTEAR